MTVVLVRHGQTDWNAERRIQGWAPTPLSERGREQATRVGEHLAATYEFDRTIASDLRRTRETADRIHRAGVEPTPTVDDRWRERDFGVYQGLTYETMFEEYPEFSVGQSGETALGVTPERGESLLDLRERVLTGLEDIDSDETVLVVTHGGPLYAVLSHATGIDYATVIDEDSQDNCAVNELQHTAGAFEAVRKNDTGYREST
ncbi:histidine phosphatase family protein [Halococcus sp. AFM35]|uniref:histidine phosphatase family protein n=1 Tax=Halococcus sp. AFM35 TaxID=3421653 RepID=UPI003EBB8B33